MRQRLIVPGLLICAVGCFAGMWMDSTLSMAAPVEILYDQTPQAIIGGTEDMLEFFRSVGFKEDFRVVATLRDETLSRRCYRVKLSPTLVPQLREKLATAWVNGRFNRAVYENGISGRVKKSRNLPKWWNLTEPPQATHLMLAHAGSPNWYCVLTESGDTCFMWVH